MTSKLFAVLFLAVSNAYLLDTVENVFGSSPSSKQFIYGEVTTIDGTTYEGQIRWGKEEAFWFDFFNSTKEENENLKWLSRDEEKALNEKDSNSSWIGNWGRTSWSSGKGHSHVFACQFGDIKSIDIINGDRVLVEFKNGEHFELDGGSNDIGTQVQVSDKDLGIIKLDWKRIDKVEFMQTPSGIKSVFGEPLYGIVKTIRGEFEGYLQWDHDERLSLDVLNGHSEDGELDIEFGNIRSIKRTHRGSNVTLKSGRSFDLHGTNDVDDDNRGIIVSTPNYGRVDITWDEFEEMTITGTSGGDELDYNSYRNAEPLKGIVYTHEDGSYSGRLIFDLDEQYKLEMLDGVLDDIEYFIPFAAVSYIEPKNRKESLVRLSNGESFVFEDKVDVDENNDGVLVFGSDNKPDYISWSDIKYITFE